MAGISQRDPSFDYNNGEARPASGGRAPTLPPIAAEPVTARQRGVYSEFLTQGVTPDQMEEAKSGPRRLVRRVQRVPNAGSFRPKKDKIGYQVNNSNAASLTQSSMPMLDVPLKALEPKVYSPYETTPGKTPRKIEIERKKRLFAAQDVAQLLRDEGVDYSCTLAERNAERSFPTYLPLEPFDDTEFDTRTPLEWLALGVDEGGEMKGVPCKVVVFDADGRGTFYEARAMSYADDTKLFTCKFEDADRGDIHVPRLDLHFLAEDPFLWARRVGSAHRARRDAEALLRYNLYVDCMPGDEIPLMDTITIERIAASTLNTKKSKRAPNAVEPLLEEVQMDFQRAMNKIIFDRARKDPAQHDQFAFLTLPPDPPPPTVPWLGTVDDIEDYGFDALFQQFTFHSFMTKGEVITAIAQVREECNKVVSGMSLFNTNMTKSLRLDDFETMQNQACQQAVTSLKGDWLAALKHAIRDNLKEVGKGWFNLSETSREVYEISKLSKFMGMVKFMMQDSLRYLAMSSLEKYRDLLVNATPLSVVVRTTNEVDVMEREMEVPKDDNGNPIPGALPPKRIPLFTVDLTVRDGTFLFSTAANLFSEAPLLLFEKAIQALQDIKQVEPEVMTKLMWATPPVLESVHRLEPFVEKLRGEIKEALQGAITPLVEYLETYKEHEELLQLDPAEYIKEYEAAEPEKTVDEMRDEINMHTAEQKRLEDTIPRSIVLGLFRVNCDHARNLLTRKRKDLARLVLDLLTKRTRKKGDAIISQYNEISARIHARPSNIEALDKQREFMATIPATNRANVAAIEQLIHDYEVLEQFRYPLSPDDFNRRWQAYGWPRKVEEQAETAAHVLEKDKARFRVDLAADQESFREKIDELSRAVMLFSKHSDTRKIDEITHDIAKIDNLIKTSLQKAQLFNSREALFENPITDYADLRETIKTFEPYKSLWVTTANWIKWHHSWYYDPFTELDAVKMEKDLNNAYTTIFKLHKFFKDVPGCLEITSRIKAEMDQFKPHVPLIVALRNPGMRDRHWDQLSRDVGVRVKPDETFTLQDVFQRELEQHLDAIQKVAGVAGKEYAIESSLESMKKEWEAMKFEISSYGDTGTYIMKGSEDIMQLLDDHVMTTQSMSFSVYKEPFEADISKWGARLEHVRAVIEQWLLCQKQWLYLQPIFSSDDINRQMPMEAKRFDTIDHKWRKIMNSASADPGVLHVCGNDKLLPNLKEANRLLDLVQKGLKDYLETKRSAFPRFYFLSDDELLEILSQTKNPLAVQRHLPKCFENIHHIGFEKDQKITSMSSAEGETVEFVEHFYPKNNVENWLLKVEQVMKATIRNVIMESVSAYRKSKRTEWITEWPAQAVLCVAMIYWTQMVTQAISSGGASGLKKLKEVLVKQLNEVTELVRGELPPLVRRTLGPLVVMDVHCRDVTQKLVENNVDSVGAFDWMSQLRYYWDDNNVQIRMVNAEFQYGYEYLGNTDRLVITPLTDRCYLTLTGALHLMMGGAPEGPAGTGKTETTKDLAKAMAKQCVVFNCQDSLDHLAMGKFFKGLASAGAWACFDEFNRIDLEVLSVIATQILQIQQAIQSKKKRFMFEEVEIPLDPSCAIFITMNPGYAGRSTLPDNLKALFRPVAMMVPDYAMIAEIFLYSYGFVHASNLAVKMHQSFKLCSEQLSSQSHYDFGMRAVKTVISAAGNLKREDPNADEDFLLLRALRDCNEPKFLVEDLPLFHGILSDLFPGKTQPPIDYGSLETAIKDECKSRNLQPLEGFIHKVIQLYETTIVRHGLMLVGPTGGGKTSAIRVLAGAMTRLKDEDGFAAVHYDVINPKSITRNQLYGSFSDLTHEWTEGVLANIVRIGAEDETGDKRWVVFDGPVDALWIENMNTVLDDNKKLCLSSGKIIKLSERQTMMFEVEDLLVASPATVSRCGMVYMEPESWGVRPLFLSWRETLPEEVKEKTSGLLQTWFDAYVPDALAYLRESLVEGTPTCNTGLFSSLTNLIDSFIAKARDEAGLLPPTEIVRINGALEHLFHFSLVWSIGATVNADSRMRFDKWIRARYEQNRCTAAPPDSAPVYDWCLEWDGERPSWVPWMDTIPPVKPGSRKGTSALVPTIDTVRYTYLLDLLTTSDHHVLCTGPTGTGKTVIVQQKLMNHLPSNYESVMVTFSARTSAGQTQEILDSKFSRRRVDIYGPPTGKKFVIMVDEFNLPAREEYGAQPPIELLRQWMDHKGWYDSRLMFLTIVDIVFVGCMGPPTGGRQSITARLVRHFNVLNFTRIADDSLKRIYSTILGGFLSAFADEVQSLCNPVVDATIDMYNSIQEVLRPTPSRSHYTYNMRDLSKVVQGILCASKNHVTGTSDLVRLWVHETTRVFHDRLVDTEDREWFNNELKRGLTKHFGMQWEELVPGDERLVFCDFVEDNSSDGRVYAEARDMTQLGRTVEGLLEEHNATSAANAMRLVMFGDAIEHVTRICRVIRQPGGHMLLLGMGGSGRQSLTRLAAFISDFELFQVAIAKSYGMTEWRDDLKTVLRTTGMEQRPLVFLFTDTQIIYEEFLEDINNILNSGDVPNIWAPDEMEQIINDVRPTAQALGLALSKASIYAQFVRQVQANVHVVVCMSPIGEVFRSRIRMFPSLVNCCTIDWFSRWPSEALRSVAQTFLYQFKDDSPKVFNGLVDMCVYIHQSVEEASRDFLEEVRRHNYVTPASFLELLNVYLKVLKDEKSKQEMQKKRFEDGLDRLVETREDVERLQTELEAMQPLLEQTQRTVDESMEQIRQDKEASDKTRAAVAQEEEGAKKKAAECKEIEASAKRDLDAALPMLEEAVESLKLLHKNQIVEIKSFTNPPDKVKVVMDAVCILFGKKPSKVDLGLGKKEDTYWPAARELLTNPNELKHSMLNFDRDNIPEATIQKITPYVTSEMFKPDEVAKVSVACKSMSMWCMSMYNYHEVAKKVQPKKVAHQKAKGELEVTMSSLRDAQQRLTDLETRIHALEQRFDEAVAEKEHLAAKVEECKQKLIRAEKLINGLADEKGRWGDAIARIANNIKYVVGDALLAAGIIAYQGPFTQAFRSSMCSKWLKKIAELEVPHTPSFSLVNSLGDPVEIRQWNVHHLPRDSLSTENGVIVKYARRWPLMIDPQGQANKWVKSKEKENGLEVIKLSDREPLRLLANAICFGNPVLLENVGEELDPSLEPILLKQTFMNQGNLSIKVGDQTIQYHDGFRFYITTKMPNPHYKPELSTKVTLLNFTLSTEGLEDQLLGIVVAKERRDLEDAKTHLVQENAKLRAELKSIEDQILFLLSSVEGSPLDDERLIDTLADSKKLSTEIIEKVEEAEKTEREIDQTRLGYTPVAVRARILFFCITDLVNIDPMYQYSLNWFVGLFTSGLVNSEVSEDLKTRLDSINSYFTYSLYQNVCRSLFEKHKLLFKFLLCTRVLENDDAIDQAEYRFLIAGATSLDGNTAPNPAPEWLTEKSWADCNALSRLPGFENFPEVVTKHIDDFKAYFDDLAPQKCTIPGGLHEKLTPFQRMLVLKCLRSDAVVAATQDFIAEVLGEQFLEPLTFDLASVFRDSKSVTPLIFILSPGADPYADLKKFAEEMRFSKRLSSISLGKGQGPRAEAMINEAMERGAWVLLENCHLAVSWLPTLERIVDSWEVEALNRDFRLWVTSMPSEHFPVMVLQDGVKMTNEPPKGVMSNLLRSYAGMDDQYLQETSKSPSTFRKLLYSLCLFHAAIQERCKFGPLGWNIPYEFTRGDLHICQRQLAMFLDLYDSPPYQVLKFLAGEVNYGGRVTDDKDRRTIMCILEDFYCPEVVQPGFSFTESGHYTMPDCDTQKGYMHHIRTTLPINDTPDIFGLHENANITFAQKETDALLADAVALQPRGGGTVAGKSRHEILKETLADLLKRVPEPFDLADVLKKHPLSLVESYTTVLAQEVKRYNGMLKVVRKTLVALDQAMDGLVVMSLELERMSDSLFNGQVPQLWSSVSYPSLKPLGGWVADLVQRVTFIQDWIDNGIPPVFWISGFYFPQAFLTGTLQNYARKHKVSIDTLSFSFEVMNLTEAELKERPEDGCYIRGLFVEGARWDADAGRLGESRPKELHTQFPVTWLRPEANRQKPEGVFVCPVYKTLQRAGELSTTGHSTNYVFSIEVPTKEPQSYWIKRGVALFCSLNY